MDSRDRIIADLRELVAKQATQLEQQAKRISELELQLAKALKNSSQLLEVAVERHREAAEEASRSP